MAIENNSDSGFDADTIQPGSEVLMHFTLSLEDGMVADSSRDGEPIRFVMGDGSLIQGLELVLYGLKVGDRQRLDIAPQDAFGFPDQDNVHWLDRDQFDADMPLEPGTIIEFETPSGQTAPGSVRELLDDQVEVDFNHPLAGHEITFDVEILEVKPPKNPVTKD